MNPPDAVTVSELADAAEVVLRVLVDESRRAFMGGASGSSPAPPAGPQFRRLATAIVNDIWVAVRLEPGHPAALDQDTPAVDRATKAIGRTILWALTDQRGDPAGMIRDLARKVAKALDDAGQLARLVPPPEVTR